MARKRLTVEQIKEMVESGYGDDLHLFSCPLPMATLLKLEQLKQRSGVSKRVLVDRALRQFLDGQ
jgi:hypothetical protein